MRTRLAFLLLSLIVILEPASLLAVIAISEPASAGSSSITNGTVTVGFNMECGGTINDLHTATIRNPVNNFDCTGRQVQTALYDGGHRYDWCASCEGIWGWDPVQGGDIHQGGSTVLASFFTAHTAYTRTAALEWFPDNKGGGPARPVPSDVEIEQWVSFVPGRPEVVKVVYRYTHLGADTHALAVQEVPAVYVNLGYDRWTRYAGAAPWTRDAVTQSFAPSFLDAGSGPEPRIDEQWSAFVDRGGRGLTTYTPSQYPYGRAARSTEPGGMTNYYRPHAPFSLEPFEVRESTVYLILGHWRVARAHVEALHAEEVDQFPPFGFLDSPVEGDVAARRLTVSGWAFDNVAMGSVRVLIDGRDVGPATYGLQRPDVSSVYPGAPVKVGFRRWVNIDAYARGAHTVAVRFVDAGRQSAVTAARTVVFK